MKGSEAKWANPQNVDLAPQILKICLKILAISKLKRVEILNIHSAVHADGSCYYMIVN